MYVPTPKDKQKRAVAFLNEQLFKTPKWLIAPEILNKIEYSGNVERINNIQENGLKKLLDLGRLHRLIENETLNGKSVYKITDLMRDLRNGIWSELKSGKPIDVYRRNLQRSHVNQLGELLTGENEQQFSSGPYVKFTSVDINTSDIKAIARAELQTIKNNAKKAYAITSDTMSKIHLKDIQRRIDALLSSEALLNSVNKK